jgi:hypothetical protein
MGCKADVSMGVNPGMVCRASLAMNGGEVCLTTPNRCHPGSFIALAQRKPGFLRQPSIQTHTHNLFQSLEVLMVLIVTTKAIWW